MIACALVLKDNECILPCLKRYKIAVVLSEKTATVLPHSKALKWRRPEVNRPEFHEEQIGSHSGSDWSTLRPAETADSTSCDKFLEQNGQVEEQGGHKGSVSKLKVEQQGWKHYGQKHVPRRREEDV
ncbi:hypothetical protein E2C01_006212 [Portunus trituberculatus]|uniref:Uncharacterized protein n=1 Tax=Portunus trituberculatus TaxID=210409 RepID=A0A5B7CYP3_PORTR|nr:hypothetical protein [Portunus trituberculatus]